MAATNNPLEGTSTTAAPLSSTTLTIAGIHVTIHGLRELPSTATSVTCLWLLNPRLQTKETMAPIANQIIAGWHAHNPHNVGLIAAAFDQRNHGTRLVDKLHNEAWRQGNDTHAQDMFGCYHGTAVDTSQLIDHLESYIFTAPDAPKLTNHFALGISLGGHATWHVLLSDPRVTAGVVGIGCPDYTRLMTDRARLSKRTTYTSTTPPGINFLGSPDFPPALQRAVERYDPAGLLTPGCFNPTGPDPTPTTEALARMKTLIHQKLAGKRILNLSGRADKLVPYAAGAPFLAIFKNVLDPDGARREEITSGDIGRGEKVVGLDVEFQDVLFEGIGHAFPEAMAVKATEWVCGLLGEMEGGSSTKGEARRGSKI